MPSSHSHNYTVAIQKSGTGRYGPAGYASNLLCFSMIGLSNSDEHSLHDTRVIIPDGGPGTTTEQKILQFSWYVQ